MRKSHLLFVCTIAALLWTTAAPAQYASFSRQLVNRGLVQADIDMMADAASELFSSNTAAAGDTTKWSNEKTGAFGTVEITEVAGNCIRVLHLFRAKSRTQAQTLQIKRCLIDGNWVLSP